MRIQKGSVVSLLGIGRSALAVAEYLAPRGVLLYAFDDGRVSPLYRERLHALGIPLYEDGEGELRGEIVFRAPAVRPDAPRLCRAALRGARVLTEAAYFLSLCPATVFGVTGSDGKTTTASYLADLLSHTGKRVYLGGNIGRSLLPLLDEMTEDALCVMELSSFQLMEHAERIYTGVLTNLTPNHLNWHIDMAEYAAAKSRLLASAQRRVIRKDTLPAWDAVRFSRDGDAPYTIRGDRLYGRGLALCSLSDMRLSGLHNAENLLAATAAAECFVSPSDVRETARRFAGAPHRMEWVGRIDGADFYNSSIDTTPSRTAVTLGALSEKGYRRVLLLCGGRDKGLPLDPLLDAVRLTGALVYLFGEAAERLAASLSSLGCRCVLTDTMERAAALAAQDAERGDAVLLSPACTSFDAYADFEARGESFRYTVSQLKNQ